MRAKFYVETITRNARFAGAEIILLPVGKDTQENRYFWQNTPGGKIDLTITNPQAVDSLELGKEYYVDFSPVVTDG